MASNLSALAASLPSRELAECHGDIPLDLPQDLWELFEATAAKHPDHEAVVSLWQSDPSIASSSSNSSDTDSTKVEDSAPYIRWTYRDLHHRCEFLAQWLLQRGCRPGMRLVVVLWNSAEWALFLWVAARLRMVFVPLDPRLMPDNAQYFLETTDPAVLVVQDGETEDVIQKTAAASLANVMVRITCSPLSSSPDVWTPLPYPSPDNMVAGVSHVPEPDLQEPVNTNHFASGYLDDPVLIVFTSGTTSRPKGCVHTKENLWYELHDYDPNPPDYFDRWLVHTPVSHIFAFNNSVRGWRLGDTVVFPSKTFDVQSTLNALVKEQCTVMAAVPALIKAILAQPTFPGKEALNLKYVTLGSTIITRDDIQLCKEKLGSNEAIQAFGMSEGAPVVSWLRKDPMLVDGYHAGVGKVLPGARLRICAQGSREPLRRNEIGELHIGGPIVVKNYLNSADPSSFYSDKYGNWLITGDQASIDDDGVLHITGRYKDIIIRAGENIPPMKIEHVLSEIPGVIVSPDVSRRVIAADVS
jgi:acyl-CoA synthetase (AMP-forming)/AMP-acid ligase II